MLNLFNFFIKKTKKNKCFKFTLKSKGANFTYFQIIIPLYVDNFQEVDVPFEFKSLLVS
jgi:hypothetical protein